jgi:hypothetical protein
VPIRVDSSALPIVCATFLRGSSDAEWEAYHAEVNRVLLEAKRSGRKIGFIVDGRMSDPPTAVQRRDAAAALERNSDLMKQTVVGIAIVLSSALQRGILTTFLWIRPFAVPHRLCATVEEAEAWLYESLPRRGTASAGR